MYAITSLPEHKDIVAKGSAARGDLLRGLLEFLSLAARRREVSHEVTA
jgi:hypothetical protein